MQTSTIDIPIPLTELPVFLAGRTIEIFITDRMRGEERIVPNDRYHWSCGTNNQGQLEIVSIGAEGTQGNWYKVKKIP
jgi:hypothetical protein